MFAPSGTGRRVRLAVLGAFAVTLLGTGVALGQVSEVIVAQPTNQFSQATYNTEQGVVVQFRNDGGSHNVTARATGPDGGPLFRSATITGGMTPVDGTQYLAAGDYAFFCTVHPTTMNGTLRVTGAGTPQPRPQVALSVRTKTISKALKKGLLIAVNASAKVTGAKLTAKLGKATIGQTDNLAFASGQVFEVVPLSKAGKAKLRHKDKATVTVSASIPFAAPASAKGKLK